MSFRVRVRFRFGFGIGNVIGSAVGTVMLVLRSQDACRVSTFPVSSSNHQGRKYGQSN